MHLESLLQYQINRMDYLVFLWKRCSKASVGLLPCDLVIKEVYVFFVYFDWISGVFVVVISFYTGGF